MTKLTVENVYTRHRAKELAKKHFWKLLGMMVIVAVIIYALVFGSVLLLNIPAGATVTTSVTLDGVNAAFISGDTSDAIVAALEAANTPAASINPVGIIVYILAMVAVTLLGGGLGLGMTNAMISLCRGESVTVGRLFSRMRYCLKALGLSLWMSLKIFLWVLPAYAVMAVVTFIILSMGQNSEAAAVLLMLLPIVVMIAVFALVFPAYYRYMLSTYILADKPGTGVFACVRSSKVLMKGHKWQAFKLPIPIILAMYGMMILFMLGLSLIIEAVAQVSEVLTVVLTIVCFLAFFVLLMYFAIRMGLAYCLFYLNRIGENCTEESAAEPTAEPAEEPTAEPAAEPAEEPTAE